jgi:hypothetical protein
MTKDATRTARYKRILFGSVITLGMIFIPVLASADDLEPASDDPFVSFSPVEESELENSRGRAVLPDGLTIEVTGLMRILVDGQELSRAALFNSSPVSASQLPLTDTPLIIQNSLNGISLEQYRELNFRISNIPISLERRFIPPPTIGTGLIP